MWDDVNLFELVPPTYTLPHENAPEWVTESMCEQINKWITLNSQSIEELRTHPVFHFVVQHHHFVNTNGEYIDKMKLLKESSDAVCFYDIAEFRPVEHNIADELHLAVGMMSDNFVKKVFVSNVRGKLELWDVEPLMMTYPDYRIDRSKAAIWITDTMLDRLEQWIKMNYPTLELYEKCDHGFNRGFFEPEHELFTGLDEETRIRDVE